jgi:type IV secretion system protein VirB10
MTGDGPPNPDSPGPRVALPPTGPSPVVVAIALCLAGGGVIWLAEAHLGAPKPAQIRAAPTTALPPSIAPLDIPPPPPPAPPAPPPPPEVRYVQGPPPPPVVQYVNQPMPPPMAAAPEPRLSEPVMTIDLPPASAPAEGAPPEDQPARAVVMRNRAMLVPQGALIPAAIETPVDSSVGGAVRAITTGDTRGFDGTRVLIPRGSHLVGEIRPNAQPNQSRVTILWTRLVRPDGVAIKLVAPGADLQGGAGVAGKVDNHLFARMGSAVLQSALTIGVAVASRGDNSAVILGLPAQTAGGIAQAGAAQGKNTPTVTVEAGTPIMVFVNRDMDFTGVLPRR